MQNMKLVQYIYLSDNQMEGDGGLAHLSTFVSRNTLIGLDLSKNAIGNAGFELLVPYFVEYRSRISL